MSIELGAGWSPKQKSREELPALDPWDKLLLEMMLLRDTLLNQPVPVVQVQPQDLSDIVQAVQGLAGPQSQLTATDIAQAVHEVLLGVTPAEAEPEWVERLLESLERLDFRMKGVGGMSGVGGTVATIASISDTVRTSPEPGYTWPVSHDGLTDAELRATPVPVSGAVTTGGLTDMQLRATDVDVADSAEREYTHVTATVTASGNTTIHTPAAGMAVRLRWIYVMTDPTSTTVPIVKVSLGAAEKYRIYGGLQKRQVTTGAADAALVVNMSTTGNVVVTAILEEI